MNARSWCAHIALLLALEVKVADLQARLDAQEKTTDEMLGKQTLFRPTQP